MTTVTYSHPRKGTRIKISQLYLNRVLNVLQDIPNEGDAPQEVINCETIAFRADVSELIVRRALCSAQGQQHVLRGVVGWAGIGPQPMWAPIGYTPPTAPAGIVLKIPTIPPGYPVNVLEDVEDRIKEFRRVLSRDKRKKPSVRQEELNRFARDVFHSADKYVHVLQVNDSNVQRIAALEQRAELTERLLLAGPQPQAHAAE